MVCQSCGAHYFGKKFCASSWDCPLWTLGNGHRRNVRRKLEHSPRLLLDLQRVPVLPRLEEFGVGYLKPWVYSNRLPVLQCDICEQPSRGYRWCAAFYDCPVWKIGGGHRGGVRRAIERSPEVLLCPKTTPVLPVLDKIGLSRLTQWMVTNRGTPGPWPLPPPAVALVSVPRATSVTHATSGSVENNNDCVVLMNEDEEGAHVVRDAGVDDAASQPQNNKFHYQFVQELLYRGLLESPSQFARYTDKGRQHIRKAIKHKATKLCQNYASETLQDVSETIQQFDKLYPNITHLEYSNIQPHQLEHLIQQAEEPNQLKRLRSLVWLKTNNLVRWDLGWELLRTYITKQEACNETAAAANSLERTTGEEVAGLAFFGGGSSGGGGEDEDGSRRACSSG